MTPPEHPRVAEVARLLRAAGAVGEVRTLPDSARTAAAAAQQLGVPATFLLAGLVPPVLAVVAIAAARLRADELAHPLDTPPGDPTAEDGALADRSGPGR